ncbi:MAG TPA: cytochrome c peroxidase [Blastocatellia bacterium]|nr:cytochrome c peroxidase [Blastocatellia bacterium]
MDSPAEKTEQITKPTIQWGNWPDWGWMVVPLIFAGAAFTYSFYTARKVPLTMTGIVEIAKRTPPDDRATWLRLARASLAAENVQPISAPHQPVNNRGNAPRIELGYLLFFDPILSGDRATSCASCHHPDYGLADGLRRGVGHGGHGFGAARENTGRQLLRNTPSLFNVAHHKVLFWDGRAGSLEEQAFFPLFSEEEMNQQSAAELLKRLRAIPQYREMFAQAFGFNSKRDGSEITLPNVVRAIAAFERQLNITETAYDYFVKGQDDKLSTEQLRGFVIFMGQGQCADCHLPPHFQDGAMASLGVPAAAERGAQLDTDPGFGAVIRKREGLGMFKTPGLRNVSRTAPYMHNGVFNSLEEVVTFYNDGGGRGRGLDVFTQDPKVAKLNLTEEQKRDLVSFLKSLDNLGPALIIPSSVPSGLPVAHRAP